MTRRSRAQMLDETRRLLLDAAREHFGTVGYAATSMDELTASAGLTRGALYHHFGGKTGLFAAVVAAVDAEIDAQLEEIGQRAADPLDELAHRSVAYIELTQRTDVQQILFQDAPSVLPQDSAAATAVCIASIAALIDRCRSVGLLSSSVSPSALAVLLNGALVDASRWVAAADRDEQGARLVQSCDSVRLLVASLR
ncbi:TetR/AcrR family transcriptional regulator [Nocardia sp. FBN12]|uniref:TetR/AcrR family transcriptional regulator n=1 Tax=Nocardia sp. FBN12 TaxID=3419766 RepID=UPI003CFC794E